MAVALGPGVYLGRGEWVRVAIINDATHGGFWHPSDGVTVQQTNLVFQYIIEPVPNILAQSSFGETTDDRERMLRAASLVTHHLSRRYAKQGYPEDELSA